MTDDGLTRIVKCLLPSKDEKTDLNPPFLHLSHWCNILAIVYLPQNAPPRLFFCFIYWSVLIPFNSFANTAAVLNCLCGDEAKGEEFNFHLTEGYTLTKINE